MDKYSRYYGVIVFLVIVAGLLYGSYSLIFPAVTERTEVAEKLVSAKSTLTKRQEEVKRIERKIASLKNAATNVQKKVYAPIEGEVGNDDDSLFFTLYTDVLDMLHANSIKIKKIDYEYNPAGDKFVEHGKGNYFVCDINMELVSNYTNLGKLIQEIYQYPYYIKILSVDITPYKKDKTILVSKLKIRLYSSTEPVSPEEVKED